MRAEASLTVPLSWHADRAWQRSHVKSLEKYHKLIGLATEKFRKYGPKEIGHKKPQGMFRGRAEPDLTQVLVWLDSGGSPGLKQRRDMNLPCTGKINN